VPGRKFHYNTAPAICQAKNTKKINKIFFLKPIDKYRPMCYNTDTKTKELNAMTIEYRPADKNYPYVIYGPWGGTIYTNEEGLRELQKEIKKTLDKSQGL
jgi:hypothetical protein